MASGIAIQGETEEGRESKKEIQTVVSELAQAGEKMCADTDSCC